MPSSGGWGEPPPGDPVLEPGDSPDHPLAPWFAHFRERHREHRAAAAPGPPRSSAVLTIAQNESVFLPIWLGYYSRFFEPEDIHVLDHGSTDGSTEAGGFVRIPVSHPTFDNEWMVATVEEHQRLLLERYDVVLVVDTDEIVAPNPGHGTLADYLAAFSEEWVNCLGYELVHMPEEEPPFRPELPVLRQRGYWFHNVVYDKPAVATVPAELAARLPPARRLRVQPRPRPSPHPPAPDGLRDLQGAPPALDGPALERARRGRGLGRPQPGGRGRGVRPLVQGRRGRADPRDVAGRGVSVLARLRASLEGLLPQRDGGPGEHWQRIRLNESVDGFLRGLGPERLSAAEISGSFHATRPWRSYVSLDFPEFDLCAPLGERERYDVVICEQVLEHVPTRGSRRRTCAGCASPADT